MKRIVIKDKKFKPYIGSPKIEERIRIMAARLNEKYKYTKEPVCILCVLNGAMKFCMELFSRLNFPVILDSIGISSYGSGMTSGELTLTKDYKFDVRGKDVIIVEDIVDTGKTTDFIERKLMRDGARTISICTLLFKYSSYKKRHPNFNYYDRDCQIDSGFSIADDFVVGYGMDYDGLGRNLNKIYVIDEG